MITKVRIKGMHCQSCKALIEDASKDVPGVKNCTVDFASGEAVIEHDETFSLDAFKKMLAELGDYTIEEAA